MTLSFYFVLALMVGALIPFQALVNSQLNFHIGHPIHAALISFAGGFLTFLIASIILPVSLPSLKKISSISPYYFTGGFIGSIFIFVAIVTVSKIGPSSWVALIVAGQLISSIIVDHYGLMGMHVHHVNWQRLIGGFLLIIGVILISKK